MSSKLSVFILLVAVSTSIAANQCRTGTVVNGNSNPKPYTFPINWDETQPAPELAANQSCHWVVTIPMGYYAKLIMSGNINDSIGYFQNADCNGNVISNQQENKAPYYFPFPKFNIIVKNQAPATFGFKIVFAPFPNAINYAANIGPTPFVMNITKDVLAAETAGEASILAFPADPVHHYTLRSAMIFEGDDFYGSYLGNLNQIYNQDSQWISPNAIMYIVNVEASNVLDQLLIQDSEYTFPIYPYKELACGPNEIQCTKVLNGGSDKSGLVYVGNKKQVLNSVIMDVTATLDVYYGGLTNASHHGSYRGSTIESDLPLTFSGNGVTQYIVSHGKSQFTFQFI